MLTKIRLPFATLRLSLRRVAHFRQLRYSRNVLFEERGKMPLNFRSLEMSNQCFPPLDYGVVASDFFYLLFFQYVRFTFHAFVLS